MTGSPLKDCLKVLSETDGDLEKSKELLRKRGLADAEKRADRLATEGLIGLKIDHEQSRVTLV
jgi:elongation factor Ts